MASSSRRRLSPRTLMQEFDDSEDEQLLFSDSSDSYVANMSSSDSESDSDDFTEEVESIRTWIAKDPTQNNPAPPRFPFTGEPGQKVPCDPNPLAYLKLFLDEAIIQIIVEETNRYAEQQPGPFRRFARGKRWEPVTQDDIWLFLAILILQGVVGKPRQTSYWSTNRLIATPFFATVMSENRFSLIMKNLHFMNNETFDEATHPAPKLWKIYDLFQMVIRKFQSVYVPERDVSVDESLMVYKGRLAWKQYISSKRARFGIKSFVLCESNSGYIWNAIIYTGKGTQFDPSYSQFGLASASVLSLISPLLGQGYCLTTDNYYTSPELYEHLIRHKTDSYGTVRPNRRNLPSAFSAQKLKPGEITAWQKGKLMALRWKDKKDVSVLSTVHNTDTAAAKNRAGKTIQKPQVILDYNQTMGGVDHADQCITFYPVVRKQQRKYYKKIFRHLVEQCLWNSYVLYKKQNDRPLPHFDYILKVCEEICLQHQQPQSEANRPGRRASYVVNPVRLTGRHFVEHVPPTERKATPTRMCVVCCSKRGPNGKKVRKETRFYCPECDVGLCAVPCFKIFHTQEVY
ncbi:piggyBac transposable element-derived protein 4-like [Hyperolius riggenbachi]|uniref:piggyBac transposable element-derived protein 4-like n=1 Tax=Hyperolius riggenbachi TaxID=752182 RepID=UPI0035A2D058